MILKNRSEKAHCITDRFGEGKMANIEDTGKEFSFPTWQTFRSPGDEPNHGTA